MHRRLRGTMALLLFAAIFVSACNTPPVKQPDVQQCKVEPPDKPVACTMQYDPVCGCDGKTYGNACMARGAGVLMHEPGACGEKNNK